MKYYKIAVIEGPTLFATTETLAAMIDNVLKYKLTIESTTKEEHDKFWAAQTD